MLPTLARSSAQARKPLIHFLGKRQWAAHAEAPHPHPYAPAEIKQSFGEFSSKSRSSTTQAVSSSASKSKSGAQTFEEFWDAPQRLRPHDLQEAEIEAILSGGASNA
ncbi:hypothetical protein EIP91_008476 [Steccherinum ochraceum]|uniref:Uncharacterized protein n=1 Tax=Steccherinum ochraceum TaxID=92696 RepID=A0A4R0RKG3_9APHY|nr:hypothetical protein EIP91_008476 [Steccherinum ochraceum]